jgi:hypothetical protein
MKIARLLCAGMMVAIACCSPVMAQRNTQVGTLNCKMGPTVGLIVGSVQRMSCTFRRNNGAAEHYSATFKRLGLDLGVSAGGHLVWGVYAPSSGIAPRALAGHYVGASGDIALGLGVGANALVGGSNRTVALQPVSVEGQVGINIALGAAGLRLR